VYLGLRLYTCIEVIREVGLRGSGLSRGENSTCRSTGASSALNIETNNISKARPTKKCRPNFFQRPNILVDLA
jgi:hypothetical protein